MATDFQAIEERRFLRDLQLPEPGKAVRPTSSGDWPTVTGRDNLHAAHRRRATTSPGQLTHRGLYGGGALLFLGDLASLGTTTRLGNDIRNNALRDDRLSDVVSEVSLNDDDRVTIRLELIPKGETDAGVLTIVSRIVR